MELFESYDRRIDQIELLFKKYNIKDFNEAKEICLSHGFDPEKIVKGIQPICFNDAVWAYTLGAAIAIKEKCIKASEAALKIGEALQSFCIIIICIFDHFLLKIPFIPSKINVFRHFILSCAWSDK